LLGAIEAIRCGIDASVTARPASSVTVTGKAAAGLAAGLGWVVARAVGLAAAGAGVAAGAAGELAGAGVVMAVGCWVAAGAVVAREAGEEKVGLGGGPAMPAQPASSTATITRRARERVRMRHLLGCWERDDRGPEQAA
jgi:hypothetical protein